MVCKRMRPIIKQAKQKRTKEILVGSSIAVMMVVLMVSLDEERAQWIPGEPCECEINEEPASSAEENKFGSA
jgi:hypothetical protein